MTRTAQTLFERAGLRDERPICRFALLQGETLRIGDDRYEPCADEDVPVLGGENAAGRVASHLADSASVRG